MERPEGFGGQSRLGARRRHGSHRADEAPDRTAALTAAPEDDEGDRASAAGSGRPDGGRGVRGSEHLQGVEQAAGSDRSSQADYSEKSGISAQPARSDRPDRTRERAAALAALRHLSTLPPDHPDRPALREHVIAEYMSYARYIAARFQHRGEASEDLEQVAYIGLVKAVDNYDPDYRTSFLTYATPLIAGEIRRHFRDTTWDVHVPRRMQELSAALRPAEETLSQKLGRAPTLQELAEHLQATTEEIVDALEAASAYSTASLDVPVAQPDGPGATLAELLGTEDAGFSRIVDRESLRPLIADLSERDKRILLMRFFRGMSQAEIGAELGVSQMQISRLLTQIIGRLREGVGREG